MNPQGKLLIIGGAEDKVGVPPDIKEQTKEFDQYELLKELVPDFKNKHLEIVTTGSEIQNEVKKTYQKAFSAMGYSNIDFIPIKNRAEANAPEYIKRAEKAATIFFTGGDQFRLSTILAGACFVPILAHYSMRGYAPIITLQIEHQSFLLIRLEPFLSRYRVFLKGSPCLKNGSLANFILCSPYSFSLFKNLEL